MSANKSPENKELIATLRQHHINILSEIERFIPDKEPKKYLYDLVKEYPSRNGKGFRPGLCLIVNKLFGGDESLALNTATALELIHNAFLVHDDVEDKSLLRRGRATLNSDFGNSIAINIGDAMNLLSLTLLNRNYEILDIKLATRIFKEFEFMITQTLEGQAQELGWIHEGNYAISEEQYLKMVLQKTCWYTTMEPIRLGIMLSNNPLGGNLNDYNYLGYYMGASFQIQDDILNLVGDQMKYGKEIGGDIIEGKRTLILINLLKNCTSKEEKSIKHILNNKSKTTHTEVKYILDMMEQYGCIEYSQRCALNLAEAAISELKVF